MERRGIESDDFVIKQIRGDKIIWDTGIGLSASCAMIPDASVCTLVIIHPEGYFPDIREVDNVVFDSYCKLRAFSEQDSELFLGQIKVL